MAIDIDFDPPIETKERLRVFGTSFVLKLDYKKALAFLLMSKVESPRVYCLLNCLPVLFLSLQIKIQQKLKEVKKNHITCML